MKLKICGVKTPQEANALRDIGVEYVGLNFVPSSSRCISLEQAQDIMAALKGSGIHVVALFQDQPIEMVSEYVRELDVDYVQLHGDEPPEYARSVPKPVIKAIAVKPSYTPDSIIQSLNNYPADYFVLDRAQQGKGDLVDAGLAATIVKEYPGKIYLAGGLTPDNLPRILQQVHPYGIDISAGVRTGHNIDMAKTKACQKMIS
jgi:phosphoribosylanthranilate isomerase